MNFATAYYLAAYSSRPRILGIVEGFAARHNVLDGRGCMFRNGAFRPLMYRGNLRLQVSHNPDYEIASQADGTLEVFDDYAGLRFRAHLADTPLNRAVLTARRNGWLSGCSLGQLGNASELPGTSDICRVNSLDEFSLTGFPCQSAATNSIKGENWRPTSPVSLSSCGSQDASEVEAMLRAVGEWDRQHATVRLPAQRPAAQRPSRLSREPAVGSILSRYGTAEQKERFGKVGRKLSRQQLASAFVAETQQLISDLGRNKVSQFFESLSGGSDGWSRVVCSGAMRR